MPDIGTTKVIDASALAAVVFDEPAGDQVTQLIRGCELIAPSLLRFEMANVCWVKIRQNPQQREALLAAYSMPGIDAETMDVDHPSVVRLALRAALTTYDASYLWLARELGVGLVTLDRKLEAAARRIT
jgi:predicted nucleic acid-binding protein